MTIEERARLGSITVSPDCGTVGEWGTWTVRYTAGPEGLPAGGAVRVALPPTWHQWLRNSARALQTSRPADAFYVSALVVPNFPGSKVSDVGSRGKAGGASAPVLLRCEVEGEEAEKPGVDLEYVKRARPNLDGKERRYGWVVRVAVESGQLPPGGAIDVLYGDRSRGGRGFTPPMWGRSPELVRAEVDLTGSSTFTSLSEAALPHLRVEGGPPTEVTIYLPSVCTVGEAAEALVVVLDANLNPSWPDSLAVILRVAEGEADLSIAGATGIAGDLSAPSAARAARATPDGIVCPPGEWSVRVPFTPRGPGVIRLRAQSTDGRLYALSNPCRSVEAVPLERLFWGDLHGHTQLSWDGSGLPEDAYRYARDVSGLQVYGNADHGESLSPEDWAEVTRLNALHLDEESGPRSANAAKETGPAGNSKSSNLTGFVTLLGFEDSLKFPYGHHNVFYRGAQGTLRASNVANLEEFWQESTPGEAITIPHHTIALGNPSRPNTDWSVHHDGFRVVAEIYSGHGQSELHADDHPLASDVVDFTLSGPAASPSAVREGWLRGNHMGTIASSDNHIARPGRDGFGIMAVYAPALTREAVFQAIRQRRTYGTTGCRLILDFAVNGVPMGGETHLPTGEAARLTGTITATGPLRFVEIMRGDLDAQEWRVAHRQWFAGSAPTELALDWTDEAPPANGLYYVRVRQRDIVHGRVAMAWSSPVWITAG